MRFLKRIGARLVVPLSSLEICSPMVGDIMGQRFCAWGHTPPPHSVTGATANGQPGTVVEAGPPDWRVCFEDVPLGSGSLVVDNSGKEQDSVPLEVEAGGAEEGNDACLKVSRSDKKVGNLKCEGLDVPIPRYEDPNQVAVTITIQNSKAGYHLVVRGVIPRVGTQVECRLGLVAGEVTYRGGNQWSASIHIVKPFLGVPQLLWALAVDPKTGKMEFDYVWIQLGKK